MRKEPGTRHRRAFRSGIAEQELREELSFHFESTVEELMTQGKTRAEAEREAERRFGDRDRYERELEEMGRGMSLRDRLAVLGQMMAYALRRIRRAPGFAAGVVLTFALGIGANATMFGIVDRLLLRAPDHVVESEGVRRLMIEQYVPWLGERSTGSVMTYPDYRDLESSRSFSSVAAYAARDLTLGRGEEALPVRALLATSTLFPLLGVQPEAGRFFGADEERPGTGGVAVLGHSLWRDHFGGDREIIGKTIDVGHGPLTVIGIAPPGFTGAALRRVDVILPLYPTQEAMQPAGRGSCLESRGCWWLQVVGRLAPGVPLEQAEEEATILHRQGRGEEIAAGDYDEGARMVSYSLIAARGPDPSTESSVALWLAGISLIVLLIACANVANLLLARGVRQQRETGIRLAVGGSRARVLGLALVEALLLAALGGVAALLLTYWGGALLRNALLPEVEWGSAGVDPRVGAVAFLLALVAGLAAGLLPAVQGSRIGLLATLKSGGRGSSTSASVTRSALTVLQAALSVVLLVGAGVFVLSLREVRSIDIGVDPDGVVLVNPVFEGGVDDEERARFAEMAVERMRALPAVLHAGLAAQTPFSSARSTTLRVPGLDSLPSLPGGGPYINEVDDEYMSVMRLRLVSGRTFTSQDLLPGQQVAVVTDLMARTLWPGEDPLGKCLIIGGSREGVEPPCSQVVGVVRDHRRFQVVEEDPALVYYVPRTPGPESRPATVVLRLRPGADSGTVLATLQRELVATHPRLRTVNLTPLRERLDPQASAWALGATMFTVFGILALLVAAVGLYSVLSFNVAQRTFELGVRSALGATRGRLMALVVGQGGRLAGAGAVLGLLFTLLVGPRIEPLLFQVSPRDPAVLVAVTLAILAVGIAAGLLPGLRATRVDPATALRME